MSDDDEPIYIDIAELLGVDADTYAAADSGDVGAQKRMLREVLTSEASAEALTTGHWTTWMVRMLASGAEQATADMLGSIAEAARSGEISAEQKAALDQLVEQYFGPGAVGAPTANRVRAAFAGEDRESEVLDLYLVADRLASGEPVDPAEVTEALTTSRSLDEPAAEAFFLAVSAQLGYQEDTYGAFESAVEALGTYVELRDQDPVYSTKVGMTALLAAQIAEIAGEPETSLFLQAAYVDDIEALAAEEDEDDQY